MKRVGLLALVLILSASGAFAKLSANGQNLNGQNLNGASMNTESSGVVIVQAITLADGTRLTVEPAH